MRLRPVRCLNVDPTQSCVYSTRTDLERMAEGEQRYWVGHVAIDCFTGQVTDKQIDVVND